MIFILLLSRFVFAAGEEPRRRLQRDDGTGAVDITLGELNRGAVEIQLDTRGVYLRINEVRENPAPPNLRTPRQALVVLKIVRDTSQVSFIRLGMIHYKSSCCRQEEVSFQMAPGVDEQLRDAGFDSKVLAEKILEAANGHVVGTFAFFPHPVRVIQRGNLEDEMFLMALQKTQEDESAEGYQQGLVRTRYLFGGLLGSAYAITVLMDRAQPIADGHGVELLSNTVFLRTILSVTSVVLVEIAAQIKRSPSGPLSTLSKSKGEALLRGAFWGAVGSAALGSCIRAVIGLF